MYKRICGIYKFTNKVNGKVYIGQSVNISQRKNMHFFNSYKLDNRDSKTYFHKAIRKYGVDNFEHEIIELCPKEKLNEREMYWIAYYHSDDRKHGYNLTKGGFNNPINLNAKAIYQIDLKTREIIKEYNSTKEASKANGFCSSNISCCLRGKTNSAYGYYWVYKSQYDPNKVKKTDLNGKTKRRVLQIEPNTKKVIKKFNSLQEVFETYGWSKNAQLSLVCSGKGKTYNGFIWCYEEDYFDGKYDDFVIDETLKPCAKIDKYSGEVLQIYPSISIARKLVGGKSKSNIGQCCRGMRKTAYGFVWRFVNERGVINAAYSK